MNISQSAKNQQQVDWRRDKVLQLASDGYGVREIAGLLKVSHPTVSRDMQWLRQQAKQQINEYITHQVPFEYKKTLAGLESIIKRMSKIIAEATDNREIMQATSLKMQAYDMKMEMVSGANLIEEAIDLVERYQDKTKNQPQGNIIQKDNVAIDNNGSSQTA